MILVSSYMAKAPHVLGSVALMVFSYLLALSLFSLPCSSATAHQMIMWCFVAHIVTKLAELPEQCKVLAGQSLLYCCVNLYWRLQNTLSHER